MGTIWGQHGDNVGIKGRPMGRVLHGWLRGKRGSKLLCLFSASLSFRRPAPRHSTYAVKQGLSHSSILPYIRQTINTVGRLQGAGRAIFCVCYRKQHSKLWKRKAWPMAMASSPPIPAPPGWAAGSWPGAWRRRPCCGCGRTASWPKGARFRRPGCGWW